MISIELAIALTLFQCLVTGMNVTDGFADLLPYGTEAPEPQEVPDSTDRIQTTPYAIVTEEERSFSVIDYNTQLLVTNMKFSRKIMSSAYKVLQYTPNPNTNASEFWRTKIIPSLKQTLIQDFKHRVILGRSFSEINQLAITIDKSAQLLAATKGSPKATAIVKVHLNRTAESLKQRQQELESLDSDQIMIIANHTDHIFQMIGAEAATFINSKAKLEEELSIQFMKRESVLVELAEKQGSASRLYHMINITTRMLGAKETDLAQDRERRDAIQGINVELEQTMKDIPAEYKQTLSVSVTCFWFLKCTGSISHTVNNPFREADLRYYESNVRARMARVMEMEKTEQKKEKAILDLHNLLAQYKAEFNGTIAVLNLMKNQSKKQIEMIDKEIAFISDQLRGLNLRQSQTETSLGLHGKALIDCVKYIHEYSRDLGVRQPFAPLTAIIAEINKLVAQDVEFISDGEPVQVYAVTNKLRAEVRFLNRYALKAVQVLIGMTKHYKGIDENKRLLIE